MPSQRGGSNEWDGRQITMGNGENGWKPFLEYPHVYIHVCAYIFMFPKWGTDLNEKPQILNF